MRSDRLDAIYGPVEKKTFRGALMQFLSTEFPHMGGPIPKLRDGTICG